MRKSSLSPEAQAEIEAIAVKRASCLTDDELVQRARDVEIETEFRFQSPRTMFVWNGRKDLEIADSGIIPGLAEEGGVQVDVATTDDNADRVLDVALGRPLRDGQVTYWHFPRQTSFYTVSWPLQAWLADALGAGGHEDTIA